MLETIPETDIFLPTGTGRNKWGETKTSSLVNAYVRTVTSVFGVKRAGEGGDALLEGVRVLVAVSLLNLVLLHLSFTSDFSSNHLRLRPRRRNGMGFFSSRKAEPTPLTPAEQASSVKVIRSRFYGKSKTNSINRNGVSSSPSLLLQQTSQSSSAQPRRDPVQHSNPIGHPRQVSTDALTMSLAERLNDLAVANADGLLDDEEYRLLRQNIFERYAAGPDLPNESPVIPRMRGNSIRGRSSSSITSPSASVTGSKFSLDQQTSLAEYDTSSIYSRPSVSSNHPYYHSVSRRPSNDSLMSSSQAGSVSGSVNHDIRSLISRKRSLGLNYAASISSRVTTRSTKPPSSFHLRHHPTFPQLPLRSHEGDDDDDTQKTAAELRAEIANVESEGRKLLDAFNGLELTTLTKSRPGVGMGIIGRLNLYPEEQRFVPAAHSEEPSSVLGSSYTSIPDRTQSIPLVAQPVSLKRKPSVVTTIAGTFKSSTSGGFKSSSSTSASASASVSTSASISTSNMYLSSPPSSLYGSRSSPNLNSASSLSSSPAVPALPIATPGKKRPSILRPSRRPVVLPPALAAAVSTGTSTASRAPPPNPPTISLSKHSPTSPSKHSPTSPSKHSPISPSKHSPTSPSKHFLTSPSKHSLTSPSKHSLTSPSKLSLTSPSSKPPIVSKGPPAFLDTSSTSPPSHHLLSATKPSLPLSPTKRSVPDPGLHILEVELEEVRRRRTEMALRYERRLDFLRAKLKSAEIREKLSRR
ncbi:hypothetical protein BU17DRAFT_66929 [Hysterangium stoloniferum]|nr:hypothetical protein BU17DRAFT_66929 [Hysterangium stoloniferum]